MTILKTGADIGNGQTKAIIGNNTYQIPSISARRQAQDSESTFTLEKFYADTTSVQSAKELIANKYSEIAIIDSTLTKDTTSYYIGQNAIEKRRTSNQFSIGINDYKSDKILFAQSLFNVIASETILNKLKDKPETLPKKLSVTVSLATALPILEGKNVKDQLKEKLIAKPHIISYRGFNEPIQIQITFTKQSKVFYEGEVGMYGLLARPDKLRQLLNEYFKKEYANSELLKDYTADDIIGDIENEGVQNTISIDIGDGTTDYALFIQGIFSAENSNNSDEGYGNVLENAIEIGRNHNLTISNRKELDTLMRNEVKSPIAKKVKQKWQSVIDEAQYEFCDSVIDHMDRSLKKMGSTLEAVYVFGGGSIPLEEKLKPLIKEKLKDTYGDIEIPVIFIPEEFAVYLNEYGLILTLEF